MFEGTADSAGSIRIQDLKRIGAKVRAQPDLLLSTAFK
jgi:hypothetical protein